MNKSEFIIGNKYIITSGSSKHDKYPHRAKGLILTALYDDGSDSPRFTLPDGMTDSHGDAWTYFNVAQVEPYVDNRKHHKHRDLIIAWANGDEIECMNDAGKWSRSTHPTWRIYRSYRIKPSEPTELEKLEAKYKELGDAIKELKE